MTDNSEANWWKDDDEILPETTSEWAEENSGPSPEAADAFFTEIEGDVKRVMKELEETDPEAAKQLDEDAKREVRILKAQLESEARAKKMLQRDNEE